MTVPLSGAFNQLCRRLPFPLNDTFCTLLMPRFVHTHHHSAYPLHVSPLVPLSRLAYDLSMYNIRDDHDIPPFSSVGLSGLRVGRHVQTHTIAKEMNTGTYCNLTTTHKYWTIMSNISRRHQTNAPRLRDLPRPSYHPNPQPRIAASAR